MVPLIARSGDRVRSSSTIAATREGVGSWVGCLGIGRFLRRLRGSVIGRELFMRRPFRTALSLSISLGAISPRDSGVNW